MDKNPGITCVVNKTNTIDSTYRNFQMEVLAGEDNMVAKVSSPETRSQQNDNLVYKLYQRLHSLSGTREWHVLRV